MNFKKQPKLQRRAVIAHCLDGNPQYCWYPQLKLQLQLRGFQVAVPYLPDILPLLGHWLKKIRDATGVPDEGVVLIGHSLGAVAVLQYLQSLPPGQRVGGVVLVAGFTDKLGYGPLANFFQPPLDYQQIRQHSRRFIVVASDNDPYVAPHHPQLLQQALGAEIIWSHKRHFTQDQWKREYTELPEVVAAVDKLGNQASDQMLAGMPIFRPLTFDLRAQVS